MTEQSPLQTTILQTEFEKALKHCYPNGFPDEALFLTYVSHKAFTEAVLLLLPAEWYASSIIQDRWKSELWFVSLRKAGGYNTSAKKEGLAYTYLSAVLAAHDIEAGRVGNESG